MARWSTLLPLALMACGAKSGLPVPHSEEGLPELAVATPFAAPTARVETAIVPAADQARADKIDLLFVIDDSGSMSDKQIILSKALPDMVKRLINPRCVDPDTLEPVAKQPLNALQRCPSGALREFNSVQDVHIGVVSSSLGGVGADYCGVAVTSGAANDRGRLQFVGVDTYEDLGFLAWDPAATKAPSGEGDPDELQRALRRMSDLGEDGCPYEMQLESWYRFLVDPEPYSRVEIVDCADGGDLRGCARPQGIDRVVLSQRSAFLRPDSLVVVIMLTDENDCSLDPARQGHRVFDLIGTVPRATVHCQHDPNDPCCQSCGEPDRAGCPARATDSECGRGPYRPEEDGGYLRCFDMKRRFGIDYRYPVERYVSALRGDPVPDRSGHLVDNPLFHDPEGRHPPRDPSLVFVAGIVGVPWQDIAVDPDDEDDLVFKSVSRMTEDGTWDLILGEPDRGVPPLDPLMRESIAERVGVHPITGSPLMPSSASSPRANPINGHETLLSEQGWELQYACIFDLPAPTLGGECNFPLSQNRAICQDDDGRYGTTQFFAKAYPGVRPLQVLRGMGDRAVVASICARNVVDNSRSDFGYRPALDAVLDRLRVGLL